MVSIVNPIVAGSGEETWEVIFSTADATRNNTTTHIAIPGMTKSILANERYVGYLVLVVDSNATADIVTQYTGPVGIDGTTGNSGLQSTPNGNLVTNMVYQCRANAINVCFIPFTIENGANAGTFQPTFSQSVATVVDTIVYKNSMMFLRKIES